MAEYFIPTFFASDSNVREAIENGETLNGKPTCIVESNVFCVAHKLYSQSTDKAYMDFIGYLLSDLCAGQRLVWAGDYAPKTVRTSAKTEAYRKIYNLRSDGQKIRLTEHLMNCVKAEGSYNATQTESRMFILNLDRKEYIRVPETDGAIHPLPYLTYQGEDEDRLNLNCKGFTAGMWRGDRLKASSDVPDGYKELTCEIPPIERWKRVKTNQ